MSSNNDNAMTRFLFAILRQKNLKDIDWNQVAHDPILAQEITNGHAARMRYSRFRTAMLGLEPTKRNRTSPPKSRVTKSKKDSKSKKDGSTKSESPAPGSPATTSPEPPQPISQTIKQENAPYTYNNRLTPALSPSPASMPPTTVPSNGVIQHRFLTPCSDTDAYPTPQMMAHSPTSDMIHSQNSFDFHPAPCPDHIDPTWTHGTSYFAAAYPYEDYTTAACDHQHLQHTLHSQCPLGLPSQSIEAEMEHIDADVKREEWNRYD
ncbi:hypothetical protein O1611_g6845 [Lasiodiplodia mahajangana]|uniref:Uncharacterized protein n=1 Tax=Lasiodiplodia mahajangana TaxID=1108764 RepID=A0ACC2JHE8_9PEZI|nr:hypothetical protein O1611_g6845 [Lasiodiplodia mahajangana]